MVYVKNVCTEFSSSREIFVQLFYLLVAFHFMENNNRNFWKMLWFPIFMAKAFVSIMILWCDFWAFHVSSYYLTVINNSVSEWPLINKFRNFKFFKRKKPTQTYFNRVNACRKIFHDINNAMEHLFEKARMHDII